MKGTTSPSTAHNGAVEGLSLLGNKCTVYAQDYDPSVLEAFENRHQNRDYHVRFECPEFTALYPIAGQPDFATIHIEYIPDMRMVGSKSLKLYLLSFRSHGVFHEGYVNIIMDDLIRLVDPKYIEVMDDSSPREGISIMPFYNYDRPGTPYEAYARECMLVFHHQVDCGMKGAKRKYLTIISPHSDTSRKAGIPKLAYNILSESGSELYFVYTNEQGHMAQIINDATTQGFDVMISVGGDGTINEVADAARPTDMAMGVIPMGSGNELARSLDIPVDPEGVLEVIHKGYVKRIDCCEADGAPFFVTFDVGFDTQVTASYDQKSFHSPLSYIISTVDQLIKHKSSLYRLHLNDEMIKQKAFLVTYVNADQCGNNAIIAPEAELDDGFFDVVVIRNMSLLKAPQVAINLFTKNINESTSIDIYRTDHLIIGREEADYAQVDSELLELGHRTEITIQKQWLPILIPLLKSQPSQMELQSKH